MDIHIKTSKNFTTALNKITEKYGEEFEYLNGFHDSQMNFSDFIDGFVDKNVADATIDSNANASSKDIASLLSEKGKPLDKLFAFNKIFYEINKKYGLNDAREWLESEYNGAYYLHDAPSATYKPYCFRGDTKILTKQGIKRLDELVGKDIEVLNKNREWEQATVKNFGKDILRKLTLKRFDTIAEIYVTGNHLWFVKNEYSIVTIQTDNLVSGMRIPYNAQSDDSNTDWIVVSVEDTGIEEDVYCAVAEMTHSFTLDNNILTHNCYAYDLTRLATEGLFFLDKYNAQPPKHLTTFLDDVIEFVSYMCNRSSGAVGLPNLLIWSFYFWKKDCENGYVIRDKDYYIKQCFQKLIYRLNQPFLRVDQSSFTNVSIFDRNYIEALFGGLIFPDGTMAIDFVEEIIEHQKIFMEVVSEIREENLFTFPVLTYSLLFKDGKFVDEDFARWCSDHNTKWNDSNFFVSDNVSTLSNCPMSGDTQILYWSEYYKEFKMGSINDVYNNKLRRGEPRIQVLSNGRLIDCKINKFDIPIQYEIELVNGAKLKTTANHLNKVYGKDYVQTQDLTTDDYLPYSLQPYESSYTMGYEDGKLVGMFLGDGSYRNKHEIVFSLDRKRDIDLIDFIYDYCQYDFDGKITANICTSQISGKQSCVNISVNSDYLKGLIQQYVIGDEATNKQLSYRCLNCSKEFRQGIIDGLYATDGGNSNRIYTSSEALKDSLVVLFASLGMVTNITTDERENRLSNNPCYTIRYYTPNGRKSLKDVYIIDDNYMWIKIKQINKIKSSETSYCLEVLSDSEPVFMLGNGVVTHNCRLLSDTSKLDAFINSIGGTALSIGSVKVNTTNLMRIFYEVGADEEEYLKLLRHRIELCCKVLDRIRHIIKRNIDKGLLPNYQDGGIELSKQYCTVGILGLYEVIKAFGYTETDKFGYISYTDDGIRFAGRIFDVINDVKDNFTTEYSINVESVPAERAAVILCAKDNVIYKPKTDTFIYSNQWIPLTEKCTINEKLRLSAVLDKRCGGGAISHINIENNFPNTDVAWEMLNKIANAGVIYFAFNTKINECKNHHGFVGTTTCPNCGEPVFDTYQRIVGFLVPSRAYSKERFKEFSARKWYEYSELTGDIGEG